MSLTAETIHTSACSLNKWRFTSAIMKLRRTLMETTSTDCFERFLEPPKTEQVCYLGTWAWAHFFEGLPVRNVRLRWSFWGSLCILWNKAQIKISFFFFPSALRFFRVEIEKVKSEESIPADSKTCPFTIAAYLRPWKAGLFLQNRLSNRFLFLLKRK